MRTARFLLRTFQTFAVNGDMFTFQVAKDGIIRDKKRYIPMNKTTAERGAKRESLPRPTKAEAGIIFYMRGRSETAVSASTSEEVCGSGNVLRAFADTPLIGEKISAQR